MGMGASTEILLKAHDAGLRVKEVPVKITYDKEGSNLNPLYHGVDVLLSTVKQWSIRHPMVFFGVPGIVSMLIAGFFWFQTFETFVKTKAIITNVTLIAVVTTLTGLILITTGVIIWVMVSVIREK
jgi:hypothetical protein